MLEPSEKYELASWDDDHSEYIWQNHIDGPNQEADYYFPYGQRWGWALQLDHHLIILDQRKHDDDLGIRAQHGDMGLKRLFGHKCICTYTLQNVAIRSIITYYY